VFKKGPKKAHPFKVRYLVVTPEEAKYFKCEWGTQSGEPLGVFSLHNVVSIPFRHMFDFVLIFVFFSRLK
jgi:hypothetical protein